MSAAGGGKSGGPNTSGPGGQGRDYNGNAIGSRMPGQFVIGGAPRPIGGSAPIAGGRPAPGDLYNRTQPGFRVPPSVQDMRTRELPPGFTQPSPGVMPGYGNPRQLNPGQGPMRPGMPGAGMPGGKNGGPIGGLINQIPGMVAGPGGMFGQLFPGQQGQLPGQELIGGAVNQIFPGIGGGQLIGGPAPINPPIDDEIDQGFTAAPNQFTPQFGAGRSGY